MKIIFRLTPLLCILFLYFSCSHKQESENTALVKTHQAVEYLVFKVDPTLVNQFIQLDHEIWTGHLKEHPGFISKEIWINENDKEEVTAVIYWNSYKEWKSIPEQELLDIAAEFDTRFGADNYALVAAYHDQNRWFKVREFRND